MQDAFEMKLQIDAFQINVQHFTRILLSRPLAHKFEERGQQREASTHTTNDVLADKAGSIETSKSLAPNFAMLWNAHPLD